MREHGFTESTVESTVIWSAVSTTLISGALRVKDAERFLKEREL